MRKFRRTIKRELFIFYIILIITFLVVAGTLTGYMIYKSSRDNIFEDSSELAYSIGNIVNIYINETNHSLKIIGEIFEREYNENISDDEFLKSFMISFVKNHTDIEKLRFLDKEGIVKYVVPFSQSETGNNLLQAPYIKNVHGKILWSDVFLSLVSGDPSVTVSNRLSENYLVLDISLNGLNLLLAEIKKSSEIIIYDSKGRAVASTNPEEVYHGVNHSNMDHVKSSLEGEVITDSFIYKTKNGEIEMLGTAIPLNNNWVVVVAKPIVEAYKTVYSMIGSILFSSVFAFGVGYLVFHVISKKIRLSIDSLINWSEKVSEGHYKNDFQLGSYKELNQLAESFKKMSENVEQREIELNNQKIELNASNEELESFNEEMAAANEELIDSEKRANELNRAKTEFLANMSHELRTPLNGIMGFSQIINSTELTSEQSDYINNVLYSSRHLLQIINDILDFSKIEAGQLDLENIDTDIMELLENSFKLIKPSADKKALKAMIIIDERIPRFVKTDPLRLSQIIINLLSNAVKFTEEGEICLKASLSSSYDKKAKILFSVSDTGIGIPEDKKEIIFEMFTQVDSSFTRKYGGTGLGLSISNKILGQMGSNMEINSKFDKGSVFSFELDMEIVENQEREIKNKIPFKRELNAICDKKIKILLVEDDQINSKLAKTIIIRNFTKAEVITAFDGREGVKKYFEHRPDLIFMDMHMPHKNGFDAVNEIRKSKFDGKRPLIIGLSADAREESMQAALENGFDDFLIKPFEKSDLLQVILKNCKDHSS